MFKDLIIVGAGGMGRELLQWVKDINTVEPEWNILGFIDDNDKALEGKECDYEIMGSISGWDVRDDQYFAIAIAEPRTKEKIVHCLKNKGAKFATIIHPRARIGQFNKIGEGTVLYPDATLSVNIRIGDFVTLLGSTVGHDAEVGDFSSIMGSCNINGNVKLGKRVFLGCQVITVPGRKIGDDAYVAAGSVVMTNIKKNTKVMGYPAKKFDL